MKFELLITGISYINRGFLTSTGAFPDQQAIFCPIRGSHLASKQEV